MFDAYAYIRGQAENLILKAFPGVVLNKNSFACPALYCEISTSFVFDNAINPEAAVTALERLLETQPPAFNGVPVFKKTFESHGHVCFELTAAVYDIFIQAVDLPEPLLSMSTSKLKRAEYAFDRMLMLKHTAAYYGSDNRCPDDKYVQRALWLCLGIVERLKYKRLLKLRINDAAEALLSMSHHLPPAKRAELLRRCGGVADCAARLLYLGLKNFNDAEVDEQ